MKKQVLVFGGLGNAKSSVVRLYEPLLQQLSSSHDVVAIDPLATDEAAHISRYQFDYHSIHSDFETYLSEQGMVDIAAVFVLTPVGSHLAIVQQVQSLVSVNDVLFVIEKPSFALDEIQKGFGCLIPKMKRQGAKFYFIETALVAPSLEYFFKHSDKSGLLPNKIVALAIDNPLASIDELVEFQFEQRLPLLNERKLLCLDTSGGAGYGFDMGIHAIAGLFRWMQKNNLSPSAFELESVKLQMLDHSGIERTLGAESHLYVWGQLNTSDAKCKVLIEAGKAGDSWDRRLELHYPDKVIAFGFGTLKHPPYICELSPQGAELKVFDVRGAGYRMHFNDILRLLGVDVPTILSAEDSERLMTQSMTLMQQVFALSGVSPEAREANIEFCREHTAYALSERQFSVRRELQTILDNLAKE